MTKPTGIVLAAGAAAGGLLAAAFLPMAVAFADDDGFLPDDSSFTPTGVSGEPPSSPEVITGTETWDAFDFTQGEPVHDAPEIGGVDTETLYGSMTNDVFAGPYDTDTIQGTLAVDLLDFNDGWGVEWVDIAPVGAEIGGTGLAGSDIGELLITPFGDVPLMGTFF